MFGLLAILTTLSALALIAGLRSRRGIAWIEGHEPELPAEAWVAPAPRASVVVDLGVCCGEVARAMADTAARQLVSLRIAVAGPLPVSVDPDALRGALAALVDTAIRSSPCGAVLLAAGSHGGRVHVSVSDDSGRTLPPETLMREVGQMVAMQGGTMEASVHPTGGTRVAIRLLGAATTPSGGALPMETRRSQAAPKPRASPQVVA